MNLKEKKKKIQIKFFLETLKHLMVMLYPPVFFTDYVTKKQFKPIIIIKKNLNFLKQNAPFTY